MRKQALSELGLQDFLEKQQESKIFCSHLDISSRVSK